MYTMGGATMVSELTHEAREAASAMPTCRAAVFSRDYRYAANDFCHRTDKSDFPEKLPKGDPQTKRDHKRAEAYPRCPTAPKN